MERNFKYWWLSSLVGLILMFYGLTSVSDASISVVTIIGAAIAVGGVLGTTRNLRKRGLMR